MCPNVLLKNNSENTNKLRLFGRIKQFLMYVRFIITYIKKNHNYVLTIFLLFVKI